MLVTTVTRNLRTVVVLSALSGTSVLALIAWATGLIEKGMALASAAWGRGAAWLDSAIAGLTAEGLLAGVGIVVAPIAVVLVFIAVLDGR